jgi:glycosyltransferase involved in cell wall biosynthesis
VPGAHAVVVGGGDEHFVPGFGAELRAKAASLGIADRTTFTGHRSDIARVLSALDVCVHASLDAEPFGMVVSEAMAGRRPVIASSAGGPAEQIEDGRSGFLVAPGDAAGIAERLVRLLRDPALRASMAEAGRRTVEERFTSERHAATTADIYERAISGR